MAKGTGLTEGQAAILLAVIDAARVELASMARDEAEGVATDRTRKARIAMVRDALNGVGNLDARRVLGFLPDTIDGEATDLGRAALAERGGAE